MVGRRDAWMATAPPDAAVSWQRHRYISRAKPMNRFARDCWSGPFTASSIHSFMLGLTVPPTPLATADEVIK